MHKSINWFVVALVLLVLIGAFLRLYRLEETLMFQGDQGRDAVVVKEIIKDRDITLLGPVTSVGNMYLGPFYYYFMAPFLALTYPNPAGPAYGVALASILTILLTGFWGKKLWGQNAAIIAVSILVFSTVGVSFSRFSWNPNIAPLFSLLTYWCTYLALSRRKYIWFVPSFFFLGLLNQTHYITLLMGLVVGGGGLIALWQNRAKWLSISLYFLLGLFVYFATLAPLVVFDWKYDGLISKGFVEFLSGHESQVSGVDRLLRIIKEVEGRAFHILAQLQGSQHNGIIDRFIVYGSLIIFVVLVSMKKIELKHKPEWWLLILWLLSGILGTAFYSDTVFDHYLLYLLPAVVWFFGILLGKLWDSNRLLKVLVVLVLLFYGFINVKEMPTFNFNPVPSAAHFGRLVQQIESNIQLSSNYNLALITESKDYRGMNYRYFFETSENSPKNFDDYDNLNQLLIIDELRMNDPLSFGIYEIQKSGLKNVVKVIELENGPRVYLVE